MPATPYQPVSFNGEMITTQKMNQMTNNDQWLFENTPRIRYNAAGITRDQSLKVMSGKTPFTISSIDYENVNVYFGSFFSAGCKPVVTAVVETTGGWLRKFLTIRGANGGELDNTGFIAHITTHEPTGVGNQIEAGGWVHWTAVGY